MIKSNSRRAQNGDDYNPGQRKRESLSFNDVIGRRISRPRRLPAWYKDYDTDFAAQEDGLIDREEMQAQLPPGIELEDPSAVDKIDVPTEEWNIVVYDDEDDDYVENDEFVGDENCDPQLMSMHQNLIVS